MTLQLNGGSLKGDRFLRVKEGRTLDIPHDPIREGYVFTGWYTDEDCTKLYDFDKAVTKRFSLFAGWEEERLAWENPFTDVHESHWYYGDVAYMAENGLLGGIEPPEFKPHEPVSRGIAAAMLWRMAGAPGVSNGGTFTDLREDWYVAAVNWANESGIAAGYGNGLFGPEDSITREQLAVMLYNYARYAGLDIGVSGGLKGYADAGDVSGYAGKAMAWAISQGLLRDDGQGNLLPQGTATRAEAAAIIHRLKESLTETGK